MLTDEVDYDAQLIEFERCRPGATIDPLTAITLADGRMAHPSSTIAGVGQAETFLEFAPPGRARPSGVNSGRTPGRLPPCRLPPRSRQSATYAARFRRKGG